MFMHYEVDMDSMKAVCNFVQFQGLNCKNIVVCSAQYPVDPL